MWGCRLHPRVASLMQFVLKSYAMVFSLVKVIYLMCCEYALRALRHCSVLIVDILLFLRIYVVGNMGQFTHYNCKIASPSWYAHCCKRVRGGAQLLSCSFLVHKTIIPLIFKLIHWYEGLFKRVEHGDFKCTPSLNCWVCEDQDCKFMAIFSHENSSPLMYQDPSNLCHFILKTNPWRFHNQHSIKYTQKQPLGT